MYPAFPVVILMIADDDEREFMKALYLDYHNIMRKEALLVLKRTEPIDDLIQDACVRLIEKIPTLRELSCCSLHAYVVYTIRSVTKNFIRRSDVQKKHTFLGIEDDALDTISQSVSDDSASVEDAVILMEENDRVQEMLSKLPERDRQLLEFKYILTLTDKEIGEVMGIKTSSVREYLTRARRKALALMKEGEESGVK